MVFIYITRCYPINKKSVNPKYFPICAIKRYTGVSYEFPSITKTAEFQSYSLIFFLVDGLDKVKVARILCDTGIIGRSLAAI